MAPDDDGVGDAVTRVQQVQGRVHRAARWHAWLWLAIAVATPLFLVGTQAGYDRGWSLWVALGFMGLGLGLWMAENRLPVRGRATERLDRPGTWAYAAAVVVVVVATLVAQPTGVPVWYAVLALVPAVPAAAVGIAILRS